MTETIIVSRWSNYNSARDFLYINLLWVRLLETMLEMIEIHLHSDAKPNQIHFKQGTELVKVQPVTHFHPKPGARLVEAFPALKFETFFEWILIRLQRLLHCIIFI